jgi:hypothetical protein
MVSGKGARNKGNNFERLLRNWDGWKVLQFEHKGHSETDLVVEMFGSRLAIEAKNQATIKLPEWWKQAKAQAGDEEHPIIVHKRKGYIQAEYQWITMDIDSFKKLLAEVWWDGYDADREY